jgi:hypothetical protein
MHTINLNIRRTISILPDLYAITIDRLIVYILNLLNHSNMQNIFCERN